MGLGMDKCCCFIPLRSGTLIISIVLITLHSIDILTCFARINALPLYAAQSFWAWIDIYLILSFFSVLCGIVGVSSIFLVSSPKFTEVLSKGVWASCFLSVFKDTTSLALVTSHKNTIVRSCLRSGIVGLYNPMSSFAPANITQSSFYTPVVYPDTLNENALGIDQCTYGITQFINVSIVLLVVSSLLQFYFGFVVRAYAGRLTKGARHHRLHDQQIKDFEDSRHNMSTVY
ncbi:hypothetical protein BDF14DRAFT_1207941 [Spinellus fusiger]|nr:hypothetical protein BDF14DRAFT_1207941 [Spinellus fusiger]